MAGPTDQFVREDLAFAGTAYINPTAGLRDQLEVAVDDREAALKRAVQQATSS